MDETTTTPDDSQAGSAEQRTPAPAATNTTPDPQAGEGQNETISLEDARKLRSEAANLRKRLKEAESLATELKTFKDQQEAAQLTEAEKRQRAIEKREKEFGDLQRAHSDLQNQLQEERVSNAIQLHATRQGIDPRLAQRLLDRSLLEHDDTGYPTNMEAAFKTMMKEYNLTGGKPAPTSGGATNPSRAQSSGGEVDAEYVADVMNGKIAWQTLTPEQRTAVLNWKARNPYRF